MEYNEFLEKMRGIKKRGFIPSIRKGPTGIGKTLEELLGIEENNIQGPDFSKYELKATRKGSSSMVTLFTKKLEPDSGEKLWEVYGYSNGSATDRDYKQTTLFKSQKRAVFVPPEERELHNTVCANTPNSQGMKLVIDDNKVVIANPKKVPCYYSKPILKETMEKKYAILLHVLAEHKIENGKEYFWYNEVCRYSGLRFETFMNLIKEGKMKVDIRIGHYPNGKVHDHGTGLRIMPTYLPECFDNRKRIL